MPAPRTRRHRLFQNIIDTSDFDNYLNRNRGLFFGGTAWWRNRVMEGAAEEINKELRVLFDRSTHTWSARSKPDVRTRIRISSAGGVTSVDSEAEAIGDVFRFVSEGTRPHIIAPRRAKALRFQKGYLAKTTPNQLRSKAGGPFGDTVFSRLVRHPGTAPRNIIKTVSGIIGRLVPGIFSKHIDRAIRAVKFERIRGRQIRR